MFRYCIAFDDVKFEKYRDVYAQVIALVYDIEKDRVINYIRDFILIDYPCSTYRILFLIHKLLKSLNSEDLINDVLSSSFVLCGGITIAASSVIDIVCLYNYLNLPIIQCLRKPPRHSLLLRMFKNTNNSYEKKVIANDTLRFVKHIEIYFPKTKARLYLRYLGEYNIQDVMSNIMVLIKEPPIPHPLRLIDSLSTNI